MHIRLEAGGTYDVSDSRYWPHDFGATQAAVTVEGDGSVLDARGLATIFHVSLPTNKLTLIGLVLTNANASRIPWDGTALLVSSGSLLLQGCRFSRCTGRFGAALAILSGVVQHSFEVFPEVCLGPAPPGNPNGAQHGVILGGGSGLKSMKNRIRIGSNVTLRFFSDF